MNKVSYVARYQNQPVLQGGGGNQTEDACGIAGELERRELKAKPVVRKLETKVETDKEQVKENPMETTECTDIEEMEPKTSIKVWTDGGGHEMKSVDVIRRSRHLPPPVK